MGLPYESAHIEGMGSTLSNAWSLGFPGPDIPGAALPRPPGASGTRSLRAWMRESQAGPRASGLGGRLGAAPASPAQAVFSAVEPQSRLSIWHRVCRVHSGMFLFAKPSSQSSGEERHKSGTLGMRRAIPAGGSGPTQFHVHGAAAPSAPQRSCSRNKTPACTRPRKPTACESDFPFLWKERGQMWWQNISC